MLKMTPAERRLDPIDTDISPEAFQEVFKKASEKKSSSYAGMHYTLWKAVAEKPDFCKYMCIMMSLPFKYGFSPRRWEHAIDCMIEKTKGVKRIHLMRIIGLVEAELNCALKIFYSQRLMSNTEKAGLSSNQWGGRANRNATTCATRKLLICEHSRTTKRSIGMGEADQRDCFDRQTRAMSTVVGRKKNLPVSVCKCDSKIVKGMNHHVKTSQGVSNETYQNTEGDTELAGGIQCRGNIMADWTLTSDSMLRPYALTQTYTH